MPAFDHFDLTGVRGVNKTRPAIIAQSGNVGQRREQIDFRQRQGRLPDSLGLAGNRGAQLGKEPPLDLDNLFLRVENLSPRTLSIRAS